MRKNYTLSKTNLAFPDKCCNFVLMITDVDLVFEVKTAQTAQPCLDVKEDLVINL